MPSDPLILTLALDDEAFARFDGLRRRHFPPERNLIPAHATLFHHLPGDEEAAVRAALEAESAARQALLVEVGPPRSLGRGVAFPLVSPGLAALRADLAARFAPWLTPQDRQGWRPHVTVQNKVAPEAARALHRALTAEFRPFSFRAPGLLLWRYLGGPWQKLAAVPFAPCGAG